MHDSSDGVGGVDGNDGNDENAVNRITSEGARAFAQDSKQKGAGPKRPWDKFDPKGKPEHRFTLRLNDYDRAIAHYVAGMRAASIQSALISLLREAAKRDIANREGVGSGIVSSKERG